MSRLEHKVRALLKAWRKGPFGRPGWARDQVYADDLELILPKHRVKKKVHKKAKRKSKR
jgi:hypothetical protein